MTGKTRDKYDCFDREINPDYYVPDGYGTLDGIERINRIQLMRMHKSKWNAIPCGYMERATDPMCNGCINQVDG